MKLTGVPLSRKGNLTYHHLRKIPLAMVNRIKLEEDSNYVRDGNTTTENIVQNTDVAMSDLDAYVSLD